MVREIGTSGKGSSVNEEWPCCTECGTNNKIELSKFPRDGSHYCLNCDIWFTPPKLEPAKPESEKSDLAERLRVATREADCERDARQDLEQFIVREYHYHSLRAEEIRERLRLNGISVGGEE